MTEFPFDAAMIIVGWLLKWFYDRIVGRSSTFAELLGTVVNRQQKDDTRRDD